MPAGDAMAKVVAIHSTARRWIKNEQKPEKEQKENGVREWNERVKPVVVQQHYHNLNEQYMKYLG